MLVSVHIEQAWVEAETYVDGVTGSGAPIFRARYVASTNLSAPVPLKETFFPPIGLGIIETFRHSRRLSSKTIYYCIIDIHSDFCLAR